MGEIVYPQCACTLSCTDLRNGKTCAEWVPVAGKFREERNIKNRLSQYRLITV